MDINLIMNNEKNMYYGHGTGTSSPEIIDSIMCNGLRCSHGSLYYTSICLGMGKHIEGNSVDLLNNWPHKKSDIVIIVSLPNKFNVIDSSGLGTYNCANAAFYYTPSEEQQRKYSLSDSDYVMPEFIKGYYDASSKTFVSNPRYYELLSPLEQERILNIVKSNYFHIINNNCGIAKYRKILRELDGSEFGLTDEDIENAKKNSCFAIFNLLSDNVKQKKYLPLNGKAIATEQYIWQFVYPYLPQDGVVIMKDNSVHTVIYFIENYILKDCIENYNGDAQKYIMENTKNNLGLTSIATTSFDGEESINYILVDDVIKYIDHDLLKNTITLFDGTNMTVKDFIINIYAPFVPHNGKVFLKDETEVTIKSFIEEYMFKDGQVAYGGDIRKILLNLTCNNNGFVTCEKNALIANLEGIKSALENYHKDEVVENIDSEEFEMDDDFTKGW